MEDDGSLGGGFWLKLIGACLLGGAVLFLILALLTHAVVNRGVFGSLAFVFAILLVVAWFYDRRHKSRIEFDEEHPEPRPGEDPNAQLKRF